MDTPLNFETLRPDIYLTEEQKAKMREDMTPPDFMSVVRNADYPILVMLLRRTASDYKYGGVPPYTMGDGSKVRNIQGVDCDKLHDFLMAVADNIQRRIQKGA